MLNSEQLLSTISPYNVQGILELIFPVGAIYSIADSSFNPNGTFPGTWTKIENRVLLGDGSKSVGSTGGSETITLTQAQMPAHTHTRGTMNITGTVGQKYNGLSAGWLNQDNAGQGTGALYLSGAETGYASSWNGFNVVGKIAFDASRNWTGSTSSVGSNQAHDNMMPYFTVCIWRRTA